MKLNNTLSMKRKSGMTLLELTVVILVLLSLISILFVGARAWKKGSDRAACILNIRNVHQAVRGHQNMANKTSSDTIDPDEIIGTNGYVQNAPVCPAGGTYELATNYPSTTVALTAAVYTCDKAADLQHVPTSVEGW